MNDMKILIVEDEIIVAEDTKDILEGLGYSVVGIVSSGKNAIIQCGKLNPDLILMDINLKGKMDGVQAAEEIAKRYQIPIIYVTAYADKGTIERVKLTGPYGYIIKPFKTKELLSVIEITLFKHQKEIELEKYRANLEDMIKERTAELSKSNELLLKEIEERKIIEDKLKEREYFYRILFELSPSGIILEDEKGIIIEVNPAYCKSMGYNIDELLGKHISILTHPDIRGDVDSNINRIFEGEHLVHTEKSIKKDGTECYVDINEKEINLPEGKKGILCVTKDITEFKHAEDKLRTSELSLKKAQKIAHIGNWYWNIETNVITWSDEIYRIFGLSPQEFDASYEAFLERVYPDDRELVIKSVDDALKFKKPYDIDHRIIWRNGIERFVHENAEISYNKSGQPIAMIGTVQDITERKELEIKIHQVQKMESIGTLAGGIAHDFNNILAAILGYTEMVQDDLPKEGIISDNLNAIFRAGLQAKELVKQILMFSRQTIQYKKTVFVEEVVKEVLSLIKATLPVTVIIDEIIEKNTGAVYCDPSQLHQIVMNLCTNAYQAMGEDGGTLEVSLKSIIIDPVTSIDLNEISTGHYILLEISDTGHGFDEDIKQRIFDPFFTTKDVNKGTGLGLSVVHGIVKAMNGRIFVKSKINQGTKMSVYLPKIITNDYPLKENEKVLLSGSERILIVDDDEMIVELIEKSLKRYGYEITGYTNSLEALDTFEKDINQFDIAIIDQLMPGMTGDKLSKKILTLKPDMSIIMMTGFSENMTIEKAEDIGIREFLLKPVSIKDLAKVIRNILDGL